MIEDIKKYAKDNRVPIITDEGLNFLIAKIKQYEANNILELGSAIGYSAINMALVNNNIYIDTIEKDNERYLCALSNIDKMELNKQINILNMDANEFESDKVYDLIFLDLAKSQYEKMINKFYNNLSDNGIIIVDNLVLYGLVLEEEVKARRRVRKLVEKIKKFREDIVLDKRFDVYFYDDIGDGMGMLVKRGVSD